MFDFLSDEEDDHQTGLSNPLLALALTNRRLNGIATAFLYQAVHIHKFSTLFSVTLTLLEAPHLARHVREVAVLTNLHWPPDLYNAWTTDSMENLIRMLDSEEDVYNTFCRVAEPFPDLKRVVDDIVNEYDKEALYYGHDEYTRDEYHENLSQFAEACCALILVFASNVVSLQMALDFKESNQPKCPLLMSIITSQVAPLALPRLQ
ncbi:hypothetical protein VTJ04DRAFT_4197 [Mycothermus thermophilus]|uniref:uncharacterized protein n=1 Tax=Humicola insolens TaxID=85995 RepID=UPI003743EC4E